MREKKISDTLKHNNEIVNQRKSKIAHKISETDMKIQMMQKIKEQEWALKNQHILLKNVERQENIKRVFRMHGYKSFKTLRRLEEKTKQYEEFK